MADRQVVNTTSYGPTRSKPRGDGTVSGGTRMRKQIIHPSKHAARNAIREQREIAAMHQRQFDLANEAAGPRPRKGSTHAAARIAARRV